MKTEASNQLHAMKYRQENETFRDAMYRIASGLKDSDEHFHKLKDILLDMRFMPAGRVQAAIGTKKKVTAFNCFVSSKINDSFVDGDNSIMDVAKEAAQTMRMGGGIGYDFSPLRPKGSLIKKLNSYASGPVSFMQIFDAICKTVASSGHRRGAQMGVLRVDHPDIIDFINAKHDNTSLTGFNISIAVTDEFMRAVENGESFDLKFNGEVYNTVDARELFETIMRSTWDYAEPGILFIDRINEMNNLWYCEEIAATNPCSEQCLPPNGACLLGSYNLVKYLVWDEKGLGGYYLDYDKLKEDIPHVVRAMDNVIDRTFYPLEEQKKEALSKRRIGIGITGLANALEAMGLVYGSKHFIAEEEKILSLLTNECYKASAVLASEKGAFPLYDAEKYLSGKFIQSLDSETKRFIEWFGIRNSHLTSIAPTGTISFTADYVSSGIEPVFTLGVSKRPVQTFEGVKEYDVQDYGEKFLGIKGKQSHEVTPQEHVNVLVAAQKYIDSAVSKTINIDGTCSWKDFKDVYMNAWRGKAKGCSTFNSDGKRFGLLKKAEIEEPKVEACTFDFSTGIRTCEQ